MNHLQTFSFYCVISILSGCTPFVPETRVPIENAMPQAYSDFKVKASENKKWWMDFNDQHLTTMINLALDDNLTIKEFWARYKQAGALAVQRGASATPDLTFGMNTSTGRQGTKNSPSDNSVSVNTQQYALNLLASYEIDLWGRLHSEKQAAVLSTQSAFEDLNSAAVTVAASVTEHWVRIIAKQLQRRLLEKQLAANQTVLELIELRFEKSMASALDVFQQRQVVEKSRAQIPLVEQSEQLLMHELALLLGKTPHFVPELGRSDFTFPPNVPETGIPVQLLVNRPDVRAAALDLQSSEWQTSAARADQLPKISLSATAALQSGKFDLLLDNWLLNLAANLTMPIFDGHRRKAEVDRTRAVVEEKLQAYRKIIIIAVKEVEDALVTEKTLKTHLIHLMRQVEFANNGLSEARTRYLNGLSDYLPVITELMAVQNLETDIILRQRDLLITRINLYRALGGTWTKALYTDRN